MLFDLKNVLSSKMIMGFAVVCLLGLSGCATQANSGYGDEEQAISDPLERFNRGVYAFNDVFDRFLLAPAARAYRYVVPKFGRERIGNFLTNLRQPVVMLNSFLQGDMQNGFSSFWSFTLNTTFGIGGLFDFAGENTNLKVRNEDFGQTLGHYGVGPGPYIVLPIIGPSNARDTVGFAADWISDPFNYLDDEFVIARSVMRAIDVRSGTLELTDEIKRNSFDPYAAIRSGFLQRRHAEVENRSGYHVAK